MPSVKESASVLPKGATWQRIDLHLHSPGVITFSLPSGMDYTSASARTKLIEEYVTQLVSQNISVCAITDYNGIHAEWFLPIKKRAEQDSILVLPGAEVSFRTGKYGLHVLAIFPEDVDPHSINSFLQSLDRDAATPLMRPDRSHRDIDPRNHVADALISLKERFQCLLIPPHPDQENGICKSLQASDAAHLLKLINPDAIEHCSEGDLQRLKSTGIIPESIIEKLAIVEFSDPKRIEDIGTKVKKDGKKRATFLKLSSKTLGALRLALHDPCTRLAVSEPPFSNHSKIRSIEVSGSGFLGNLHIAWNEDLNVIIGGRGAGKSAVAETLRYAFGAEPYSEAAYRAELVQHALGSGGKVTVVVDLPIGKDKVRTCKISRVWGEEPRVYDSDSATPIPIEPFDLFGSEGAPTMFGQREIYAVSGSEDYRLRLLDDLIGDEANKRADEVQTVFEELKANAASIIAFQSKLNKREEYKQRLHTINHDIAVYEKYGVAQKLKTATALRVDGQHLRAAANSLDAAQTKWQGMRDEVDRLLKAAGASLKKGQSVNKSLLLEGNVILQKLTEDLNDLGLRGGSLMAAASKAMGELTLRWQESQKPLEEELNKIKQEVKSEQLDPDRLILLNEERAKIAPEIEELDRIEAELKNLRQSRLDLIAKVRDCRHDEYELRRQKAEAIGSLLEDRLHVRVEFKGHKGEYRRRLFALLKGSGVSADAVERLVQPDATDGLTLAETIRAGAPQIQIRFGLTIGMADRLVKWFSEQEGRIFELETVMPGDGVQVDLKVDDGLRSLERLSPGQRATAILLLLFAQKGRLLILDQPEDDLDSRFIYEDVVQILRDQKSDSQSRRRQIIAVTHNPNIPVLGDAELVVVLESHEGKSRIIGRASIDDKGVCEHIKSIMEGGEEAFKRRAEKYAGF